MITIPDILGMETMTDNGDFDTFDTNGDGIIDINDCPFNHGSPEAKLWWDKVQVPYTKSQINDDMTSQYGDQVTGAYQGKPLVPGDAGSGQGDFQYLVDKLMVTKGFSKGVATKIAGKLKWRMYPGG